MRKLAALLLSLAFLAAFGAHDLVHAHPGGETCAISQVGGATLTSPPLAAGPAPQTEQDLSVEITSGVHAVVDLRVGARAPPAYS